MIRRLADRFRELSDCMAGSVDASDAVAHYDILFVTHYGNILIV
jgi:hypothetical protein